MLAAQRIKTFILGWRFTISLGALHKTRTRGTKRRITASACNIVWCGSVQLTVIYLQITSKRGTTMEMDKNTASFTALFAVMLDSP